MDFKRCTEREKACEGTASTKSMNKATELLQLFLTPVYVYVAFSVRRNRSVIVTRLIACLIALVSL